MFINLWRNLGDNNKKTFIEGFKMFLNVLNDFSIDFNSRGSDTNKYKLSSLIISYGLNITLRDGVTRPG